MSESALVIADSGHAVRAVSAEDVDALGVLERYPIEKRPPHLGEITLLAVLAELEAKALFPVVGVVPNTNLDEFGSLSETQSLLAECRTQLHIGRTDELPPGSFVGPYVVRKLRLYYPTGISIWVPR